MEYLGTAFAASDDPPHHLGNHGWVLPLHLSFSSTLYAGDYFGQALSTLTLTSSRVYLRPFVVSSHLLVLMAYGLNVTSGTGGGATLVGFYDSDPETYAPANLLMSGSVTTALTGFQLTIPPGGPGSFRFERGRLYWSVVVGPGGTVRALVPGCTTSLGRSGTAAITHYFTTYPGSLPNPWTGSLTAGTGNCPAVVMNLG